MWCSERSFESNETMKKTRSFFLVHSVISFLRADLATVIVIIDNIS